jgi:hypothetical protein
MSQLPDDVHANVVASCERGERLRDSGDLVGSVQEYQRAWDALPEPREEWEAAAFILTALADARFHFKAFEAALSDFQRAVRCPGGLGNPFVHLRIGQCQLELGNERSAADELARAYMGGGAEIFEEEDPKFFAFVKTVLREPAGGW